MKTSNIIGLIAIAAAIGILISMTANFSQYTNFEAAIQQPDNTHQIVGKLSLDDPIIYNPEIDPNSFSFFMIDEDGLKKKVICQRDKPQDFERSEQVVLKGRMDIKKDLFVAHEIQLKCPSKYQDEAIQKGYDTSGGSKNTTAEK
ncbi:MAG: cytochrome c maturation protein CcmE [Saprospiraceae bacterium]|nr:cytochrome c maturation protein CcmE [Saprospiraceae bacterium]